MHVVAFIGEPQHFKNSKLLYLSTCKWAISLFLSDQVTYDCWRQISKSGHDMGGFHEIAWMTIIIVI